MKLIEDILADVDLTKVSEPVLRGVVLLGKATVEEWDAASAAGLVVFDHVWDDETAGFREVPKPNAEGAIVLEALAFQLRELCPFEIEVLGGKHDGWGAAQGEAFEVLRSRGLMGPSFEVLPHGRAAYLLHELEVE